MPSPSPSPSSAPASASVSVDKELWQTLQRCMRGTDAESRTASQHLRRLADGGHASARTALAYFLHFGLHPFEKFPSATSQADSLLSSVETATAARLLALVRDDPLLLPPADPVRAALLLQSDPAAALRVLNAADADDKDDAYGLVHGLVHEVGLPPHVPRDVRKAREAYARYPTDPQCLARLATLAPDNKSESEREGGDDKAALVQKALDHSLSTCDADTFIQHGLCSHLALRILRAAPRIGTPEPDAVWQYVAYHSSYTNISSFSPSSSSSSALSPETLIGLLRSRSLAAAPRVALLAARLRRSAAALDSEASPADEHDPLVRAARSGRLPPAASADLAAAAAVQQAELPAVHAIVEHRAKLSADPTRCCLLAVALASVDHGSAGAVDAVLDALRNGSLPEDCVYIGFDLLLACLSALADAGDATKDGKKDEKANGTESTEEDERKRDAALLAAKLLLGTADPEGEGEAQGLGRLDRNRNNNKRKRSTVPLPNMPTAACVLLLRAAAPPRSPSPTSTPAKPIPATGTTNTSDDSTTDNNNNTADNIDTPGPVADEDERFAGSTARSRRVAAEAAYICGILLQATRRELASHLHLRCYALSRAVGEERWYTPRAACNAGLLRLTEGRDAALGGSLLRAAALSTAFRSDHEKAHALVQYGAFLEAVVCDVDAARQQYANIVESIATPCTAAEINLARLCAKRRENGEQQEEEEVKTEGRARKIFVVQPVRFYVAVLKRAPWLQRTDGPVGLALFHGDKDGAKDKDSDVKEAQDVEPWARRLETAWRAINEFPVRAAIAIAIAVVVQAIRRRVLHHIVDDNVDTFISLAIAWTCLSIAFSIRI